ncbi:MAG: hypothetical protein AAFR24_06650 [Cyanobacteria bacterium J06627_3]
MTAPIPMTDAASTDAIAQDLIGARSLEQQFWIAAITQAQQEAAYIAENPSVVGQTKFAFDTTKMSLAIAFDLLPGAYLDALWANIQLRSWLQKLDFSAATGQAAELAPLALEQQVVYLALALNKAEANASHQALPNQPGVILNVVDGRVTINATIAMESGAITPLIVDSYVVLNAPTAQLASPLPSNINPGDTVNIAVDFIDNQGNLDTASITNASLVIAGAATPSVTLTGTTPITNGVRAQFTATLASAGVYSVGVLANSYRDLEGNQGPSVSLGSIAAVVPSLVQNASPVKSALQAMSTQRVGVVAIADSNAVFNGEGYDAGFQKSLNDRYSMYGTGFISLINGFGKGWFYTKANSSATGIVGGANNLDKAPAPLSDSYLSGVVGDNSYVYLPDGSTYSGSTGHGAIISSGGGIDIKEPLDFLVEGGTFDSGAGSYTLRARRESAPYSTLKSANVDSNTGAAGKVTHKVSVDADPARDYDIGFRLMSAGGTMNGPAFFQYLRAIHPNRNTGFSYNTFFYQGGSSLKDMAEDINAQSDAALTSYFSTLRGDLGASPKVIIYINSGVNDRNEADPSTGNSLTPGDSQAAYEDNLKTLIEKIESIWTLNNWALSGLSFLVVPSHKLTTEDAELESYVAAAKSYAGTNNRVTVIDTQRYDSALFTAGNWYASPTDENHLSVAGYEGYTSDMINKILAA